MNIRQILKGKVFSQSGFTMLEMLASIVILGVVSVNVMRMYGFGSRVNALNEESVLVSNLLQKKIEEIKTNDFTVDVTETGVSYPGYAGYTFNVVETVPYNGNAYLKLVSITINWTSYVAGSQAETFSILIADV